MGGRYWPSGMAAAARASSTPARQISARTRLRLRPARYSVYLLYWYNSTHTDAEGAGRHRGRAGSHVRPLQRDPIRHGRHGQRAQRRPALGAPRQRPLQRPFQRSRRVPPPPSRHQRKWRRAGRGGRRRWGWCGCGGGADRLGGCDTQGRVCGGSGGGREEVSCHYRVASAV